VFIAMGSVEAAGVAQRIAINAAAATPTIEQVTRLSVLNASVDSLGINRRRHAWCCPADRDTGPGKRRDPSE
jgi:hypothetical protein